MSMSRSFGKSFAHTRIDTRSDFIRSAIARGVKLSPFGGSFTASTAEVSPRTRPTSDLSRSSDANGATEFIT